MNMFKSPACTIASVLLLAPITAGAHHSHSSLDRNMPVTLSGVVSEYLWKVPHVYLIVDVPQTGDGVVQYTIETLNPPSLARLGWTTDTFRPGDRIIWHGSHDRDPNRPYTGLSWAEMPNGFRLFGSAGERQAYLRENGEQSETNTAAREIVAAREFPSGGYWTRIGPDGGRFSPYREPPSDWPLTPRAGELIASFHESQNPLNDCVYPGPPRAMLMPMAYHFRWEGKDKIIIDRDLWPEPRTIYLGEDLPHAELSRLGLSVGRFEGKELVVETTGFESDRWGTRIGIDSSAQKNLVERYWLSEDGMRLNLEFTVTDPEYLAESVTMTHQWGKVTDRPLLRAECSMESAWFYITAGYQEGEYEAPVKLAK
ncbi:MAG: DUF6152 family protein [Gammaproteobacteria bacterium]